MQLSHQKRGKYLLVKSTGRLDAAWADHFSKSMQEYIRQGEHHLLLDATGMEFLSSAGIRSIVQLIKSVKSVNGSFQIIKANDFVKQTLTMTGFGGWLTDVLPEDIQGVGSIKSDEPSDGFEAYKLDESGGMMLSLPATWKPWRGFNASDVAKIRFQHNSFALGIGSPVQAADADTSMMGEFLAVAGNTVHQPPREDEDPDFLLAEKDYLPELHCMQALHCNGEMSHLLRFAPSGKKLFFGLGEIADKVLAETNSELAAFVILAEIDGLVGSYMKKSPGLMNQEHNMAFPESRQWLSFCGERMYARQQALVFGLAACPQGNRKPLLMAASGKHEGLFLHAHATVFPYQPMESGKINLKDAAWKFFNGSPPMALYHLVEDIRPVTGLGESAFIRGACWCAPIINHKEDLLWE